MQSFVRLQRKWPCYLLKGEAELLARFRCLHHSCEFLEIAYYLREQAAGVRQNLARAQRSLQLLSSAPALGAVALELLQHARC